ncbi:MAG: cupin domain-containing protein [Proteobacteria bacterium]|nr:cupin domain-containing protein [Pseudomonadota bacterium]
MEITVDKNPDKKKLESMAIKKWSIWEETVSEFPWYYQEAETCYILEGSVIVTPDGGSPIEIEAGDLVTFPKGMSCTWKILKDVRKHYKFV